ncbi:hypothetical protein [Terribacillus sp. AE2B 122]|uniref:hypothetical protein n=1 Tax=Terribacillus sp. AE2B 122 TaxID=1331902 RepID=UPI00158295A6|nr:hypothetical protein [Terribacillus sp. AE2B 122]
MLRETINIYMKYNAFHRTLFKIRPKEERREKFAQELLRQTRLDVFKENHLDLLINLFEDEVKSKSNNKATFITSLIIGFSTSTLTWLFREEGGAEVALMLIAIISYIIFLFYSLKGLFSEYTYRKKLENTLIYLKTLRIYNEINLNYKYLKN